MKLKTSLLSIVFALTTNAAQAADIVAFLNGLTGEFPEQSLPRLPATPGWTLIGSKNAK